MSLGLRVAQRPDADVAAPSVRLAFGVSVATEPSQPGARGDWHASIPGRIWRQLSIQFEGVIPHKRSADAGSGRRRRRALPGPASPALRACVRDDGAPKSGVMAGSWRVMAVTVVGMPALTRSGMTSGQRQIRKPGRPGLDRRMLGGSAPGSPYRRRPPTRLGGGVKRKPRSAFSAALGGDAS